MKNVRWKIGEKKNIFFFFLHQLYSACIRVWGMKEQVLIIFVLSSFPDFFTHGYMCFFRQRQFLQNFSKANLCLESTKYFLSHNIVK